MNTEIKVESKGNEIHIREGKLPELHNPSHVNLSGNIYSPGEFVTKRKEDIPANKTNVVFDYDNLTITLTVDEENHFKKTVSGKIERFDILEDFGINKNKYYSISDLISKLKLKRAYFPSREEHELIMKNLMSFTASTQTEFQSANDFKGNVAISKIQKCKTNLEYEFILSVPIFKAMEPTKFKVSIEFEPIDGSIVAWLISPDLAEIEIKQRDELMNSQLEIFKDYVVIKK